MISVITITFNNFDELLATIDSVKGLTNIEHIVINGGSCEKTKDYLNTKFKGKYLSEKDQGISDAFNKGASLASGKGIIFLNSGDLLIDPAYLNKADQLLDSFDYIYADINFSDPLAGIIRIKPTFQALGRGMPYPHQTLIVRTDVFKKVGNFKLDYKRAMCFEFACRLENATKNGFYYENPVVLMEGTGISITQEDKTIDESERALIENGIFNFKNRSFLIKRKWLFYLRKKLIDLGLSGLLIKLKRLKNS